MRDTVRPPSPATKPLGCRSMSDLIDDLLADGTLVLRSRILLAAGFQHAFSTGLGPEGRRFDLSRPGQSPMETPVDELAANLRRFADAVAVGTTIASPRQVHGVSIAEADVAESTPADLVASTDPTRLAAVRTADCVPILLGCRRRGAVVAVHAGWRGIVGDAPGTAVRHLVSHGSTAADLVAAIGPAIGLDAFEVGPEVAAEFTAAGLGSAVDPRQPKPHVDLHAAARQRLLAAGLAADAIGGASICTAQDPRFFSHRGDRGRTGRHLSAIRCWQPVA
jgi:YfiH family protein